MEDLRYFDAVALSAGITRAIDIPVNFSTPSVRRIRWFIGR
jgi:hypothetical protein